MPYICTGKCIHTYKLCNYVTLDDAGLVRITDPQVIDSGIYTCRVKSNHSDYEEVKLIVSKCKKQNL